MAEEEKDENEIDFDDPALKESKPTQAEVDDEKQWVCICIDCNSPNRPDSFIRAGEFGVCKACGGKTKEILKKDYEKFRKMSQPGWRAGPGWSRP
jgi:hypothetical protein